MLLSSAWLKDIKGKYSRRAGRGETESLICVSTVLIYHCKLAAGAGLPLCHCCQQTQRHSYKSVCPHSRAFRLLVRIATTENIQNRIVLKPHLLDNNATWDVWTYYNKWISRMCCFHKTRCCSSCVFLPDSHKETTSVCPWHPPHYLTSHTILFSMKSHLLPWYGGKKAPAVPHWPLSCQNYTHNTYVSLLGH